MRTSNRVFLLLLTTASVVLPLNGEAQSRKFFGMFSAGPALPVGTFGDAFDMGWSLSAGVGTALANKAIEVRATASYGSFGASNGGLGVDGNSTPFALTGDVLYHLGSGAGAARPYLLAGAGLSSVGYSSSYDGFGGGGEGYSERENGLTFGVGGGVLVQRGKAGFFAEGRYAAVPGSEHSHLPVVVGVRIGAR